MYLAQFYNDKWNHVWGGSAEFPEEAVNISYKSSIILPAYYRGYSSAHIRPWSQEIQKDSSGDLVPGRGSGEEKVRETKRGNGHWTTLSTQPLKPHWNHLGYTVSVHLYLSPVYICNLYKITEVTNCKVRPAFMLRAGSSETFTNLEKKELVTN